MNEPRHNVSQEAGTARLVQTKSGLVSGSAGLIAAFKGIPYAAAPTGALRWRPPQPPAPWRGVRRATEFGADPPQAASSRTRAGRTDEDCLTLNVWTPAKDQNARLPVMIWLYGGSYVSGSASDPRCDGESFARKGVVVVTVNYRIGLLGFMAHPGLTKESAHRSSGNYGLLDTLAALGWVRRNIAAFGGDPERVTLFGVSRGCRLDLASSHVAARARLVPADDPAKPRGLSSVVDARGGGGRGIAARRRHRCAEAHVGRRAPEQDARCSCRYSGGSRRRACCVQSATAG